MKYLYYKLFKYFKKIKTNDTPATNAMIFLDMILGMNIVTTQILLNHFFNIKLKLVSKNNVILFAISLGIILYMVSYFKFYKKRDIIYNKYSAEDRNQNILGYAILILYVLISVILLFYFGSKFPL